MQLTPQELRAWHNDPTTHKIVQFMLDLRQQRMEQWAQGGIADENNKQTIGFCLALEEITELTHEKIAFFYGVEIDDEKEEDDQ